MTTDCGEIIEIIVPIRGRDGQIASDELIAQVAENTQDIVDVNARVDELIISHGALTDAQARAIAENAAKVGITEEQAQAITLNSLKEGITEQQANDIIANNGKVGITGAEAAAIVANSAKVGITNQQAMDILANNEKVGITTAEMNAIIANSAKVGITQQQAMDILANNAKMGITEQQIQAIIDAEGEGLTPEQLQQLNANTAKIGITNQQALDIIANNAKDGITQETINAIAANSAKVGITTAQALAITANTAKNGITPAHIAAINANSLKNGITDAQALAIAANSNKHGITDEQTLAIIANTGKVGLTQEQIDFFISAEEEHDDFETRIKALEDAPAPETGGVDAKTVNALIDAKQIPSIFQSVGAVVPQQHPMTNFVATPANSPLMTTPFTFPGDFTGIAAGTVVKLAGTFYFGLSPSNGSLPLCSLVITQGTRNIGTLSNLAAQGSNPIEFLSQAGAGDIKIQPIVETTNQLNQSVYPYMNAFDVLFTGAYHDILLKILAAQIALATAETRSLLQSTIGQVQHLSGLVQNHDDDILALRATLTALVNRIDNPSLDFLSQGTLTPGTTTATIERTALGDALSAEIVDHNTIESPFKTAAQEMRSVESFNTATLAQQWFDSTITQWAIDESGSTGSTGAGPGTNSPGPYLHWEASGSARHTATPITITGGTAGTDVQAWLAHNGLRNIEFLYNYVSTSSTGNADAFFVAEQLDKDGAVIATRQYSEWAYYATVFQGQVIPLETGGSFTSELPGGWRRVGMDLLPECRSVKLYNIPEGTGSGDFVNDLAFYDIRISESGLDTPSDSAASGSSGASGQSEPVPATSKAGAAGQSDGNVHALIIEMENNVLTYGSTTIAAIQNGNELFGFRVVPEQPATTRTETNFTGATPASPFSIALGANNQHAVADRSFAPPSIIPTGTVVTGHMSIFANQQDEDDFTLDYTFGSGTVQTEVFTLGGEMLTVLMDEQNGEVRIRTQESGDNNLALDGGELRGYFSFPVAVPKVDATTEAVRLQNHSGKSILGFADEITDPTLVIYYGNGQSFDTGVVNTGFLEHNILTTSGNPAAFRATLATADELNVTVLQANYNAGVRYLGLFFDKPHHSMVYGVPGGMTVWDDEGGVHNVGNVLRDAVSATTIDELHQKSHGAFKKDGVASFVSTRPSGRGELLVSLFNIPPSSYITGFGIALPSGTALPPGKFEFNFSGSGTPAESADYAFIDGKYKAVISVDYNPETQGESQGVVRTSGNYIHPTGTIFVAYYEQLCPPD